MKNLAAIAAIQEDWEQNPRWRNVKRDYTAEDAYRLRGSFVIEYTLAHCGAEKLRRLLGSTEEAQFHGHDRPALHIA